MEGVMYQSPTLHHVLGNRVDKMCGYLRSGFQQLMQELRYEAHGGGHAWSWSRQRESVPPQQRYLRDFQRTEAAVEVNPHWFNCLFTC